MNIAVAKTAAEAKLSERFDAIQETLPGGPAVHEARRNAIGTFAALGLPHRRIEEWKYSDVRATLRSIGDIADAAAKSGLTNEAVDAALGPLADAAATRIVIVDGRHSAELSSAALPPGVDVRAASDAFQADEGRLSGPLAMPQDVDDALVALNAALASDGVLVEVSPDTTLEAPLAVVYLRTNGAPNFIATRNALVIGAGATATIVEAHVSAGDGEGGESSIATNIHVGDGATVTHVKVATEKAVTHLAAWNAVIGAESNYRPFFYTTDVGFARNSLFLRFAGEGSKLDCSGCLLAHGGEHIDNTLVIDHAVPGCESRELFKAVLDDEARGVFQGKVIVRQIAQKTDGKQMAQALMLSPTCEFDSKPELEIYADDVVCGHGSTCTELDPELVFYLRSRGITDAEARALLMESFVGEAIECVEDETVAAALTEMAQGWLQNNWALHRTAG